MAWITDNVFVQDRRNELVNVLAALPDQTVKHTTGRRFVHILNAFPCPPGSENDRVHRITYGSLLQARAVTGEEHAVEYVAVVFPEDEEGLPALFQRRERLERSVLDLRSFDVERRLPLLFDVLEKGASGCGDDDILIFTNMDIVVLPQFYLAASKLLDLGFEAAIINRRTIPKYNVDPTLVPLMSGDLGKKHPGYDCLVFPARFMRRFLRNDAAIGAGASMRGLLFNMVAVARPLVMLNNMHLTFHLGHDRPWRDPEQTDFRLYNRGQAQAVLDGLAQDPEQRRLLEAFLEADGQKYKVGGAIPPIDLEREARSKKKFFDN